MPSFQASLQHLFVLPLKGPPGEPKNDDDEFLAPECFTSIPIRANITSTTHYYIIGGQHCVAAYQFLIDEGNLSLEDVKDAWSFIVTIVWAASSDFLKLTYYSRVLNQDLAGNRTEGFLDSTYYSTQELGGRRETYGG
jgi:hypothetical protein